MTGSDDYVCEHCGEVFESEAGVDMHRERNHGEAGASSGESDGFTLQLSTSHAMAASFLIGIFVGGFFMGALGGSSLTGNIAAPTVDTGGNGGSPSDTGNTGNNGGTTKIDMSKIEMKGEPVLGQKDAPVTMVVYEDFECPFCKRFEQGAIPKIVNNYVENGKVKIVWKDFPLTQLHPWAKPAAAAMECVYRQDNAAFWAVKKKVFDNQNTLSTSNVQSQIISWAAQEGVSESAVRNCLQNGNPMQEVNADKQEGSSLGVSGTPTAFVGGVKLVGAQPYSRFKTVIENQLQG